MSCYLKYTDPFFASMNWTSTDAGEASAFIHAGCTFVEKFCNRQFSEAEFDEVSNVTDMGGLILNNYPVKRISRMAISGSDYFQIHNTGSATHASYSTTVDGLTLTAVAGGERTTNTLLWTDCRTLAELSDAVSNLIGWTSTVFVGKEDWPTTDIVANQFGGAKNSPGILTSWDDAEINFEFDSKSGIVGFQYPSYPALGMGRLPRGSRVRTIYTAGYSKEDFPDDLKMATANLIIGAASGVGPVIMETLGSYSYQLADVEKLAMHDKKILNQYKDRRV